MGIVTCNNRCRVQVKMFCKWKGANNYCQTRRSPNQQQALGLERILCDCNRSANIDLQDEICQACTARGATLDSPRGPRFDRLPLVRRPNVVAEAEQAARNMAQARQLVMNRLSRESSLQSQNS